MEPLYQEQMSLNMFIRHEAHNLLPQVKSLLRSARRWLARRHALSAAWLSVTAGPPRSTEVEADVSVAGVTSGPTDNMRQQYAAAEPEGSGT